jgi:hypothetical protein
MALLIRLDLIVMQKLNAAQKPTKHAMMRLPCQK